MKKIVILALICLSTTPVWAAKSCPNGSVKVLVINTSPYTLVLQSKPERKLFCKVQEIAKITPKSKKKYFCVKSKHALRVLTFDGEKRLAMSSTDLWSDIVVITPEDKVPDIEFQHLRGDVNLVEAGEENEWVVHEFDESKAKAED